MQLFPFYAVCDESGSMYGEPVATVNRSLIELHAEISTNPTVADKARFCLVGFSTSAKIRLPLSDLSDTASIPSLTADGSTSYSRAFDLLRTTIEQDVAGLKAADHQVLRPTVFFMSDGIPTDQSATWQAAHTRLVSAEFAARPNVVAFGIGDADTAVIRRVATYRAFIQQDGELTPAQALREFVRTLINSIVNSVNSATRGVPTLEVPLQIPGFETHLPMDEV